MKKYMFLIIFIFFTFTINAQDNSWKYYAQTPPGNTAELFAPEIIRHLAHSSPTFTPDGKEIYWSTVSEGNEPRKIYVVKFENNTWSKPMVAGFSGNYHDDQPFISYDGKKLFFASKRPKVKNGKEDLDIWMLNKTKQGWSQPAILNNCIGLWTPTVTRNGTIYFLEIIEGARVICRAELKNGEYSAVECLNENINKKDTLNWCPFIASDESYLIFSSHRDNGFGSGDLYISFKSDTGEWEKAVNMGPSINTDRQERFPGVSPDGKYLFFTRSCKEADCHDLYWIDAGIIDELRGE